MHPSAGVSSISSIGQSSSGSIIPSIIFWIISSLVLSTLMATKVEVIKSEETDIKTNVTESPIFPENNTKNIATACRELQLILKPTESGTVSEAEDMLNSKTNKTMAAVDVKCDDDSSLGVESSTETIVRSKTLLPKTHDEDSDSSGTEVTDSTTTDENLPATTITTTITTADPTTTTIETTTQTIEITTTTITPETTTPTTTTIATTTTPKTTIPPTETQTVPVTETPETVTPSSSESVTEENDKMSSGIVVLVTMITFAIVALVGYVSLIVWRRYLDYRYGSRRELLVNDLEFDTNDLRHFEL